MLVRVSVNNPIKNNMAEGKTETYLVILWTRGSNKNCLQEFMIHGQHKQFKKFCRYALSLMDRKPNEVPSAYYKPSRLIDAFVKTERTNGAPSPGCIVAGTIV